MSPDNLPASQSSNAVITLANGIDQFNNVVYEDYQVNIYSINMSINADFNSPQVRKGVVWSPLRILGNFGFSIRWASQTAGEGISDDPNHVFNHNGFKKMNRFHNALRFHQKLAATTGKSSTPMRVLYYNNSGPRPNPLVNHNLPNTPSDDNLILEPMEKYGFITLVRKEYDRFKPFYDVEYQLELTVPRTQPFASITYGGTNSYILPDSTTVLEQGPNWAKSNIALTVGINIDGIPN